MKINWKSKTFLTATVMIIVYIGCLTTSVMATSQTSWFNTMVSSKGTITITAQNFSYTVSGIFDFGTHQYFVGDNINITSTPITITNTGNQEIKGWSVSTSPSTTLPNWIGFSISQTDIVAGGTGQVTITLTATNIPNSNNGNNQIITFVGATPLTSISFNITPTSTPQ
jgi:hypothetical protein